MAVTHINGIRKEFKDQPVQEKPKKKMDVTAEVVTEQEPKEKDE